MPAATPPRSRPHRWPRACIGGRHFCPPKLADPAPRTAISGRRYYSPNQGRFLGRDPIQEEGGLNLYGFCGSDAVNFWDALGNIAMGPGTDPDEFMRQAAAMFQGTQGDWTGFAFEADGADQYLITATGTRYLMQEGGAAAAYDVQFLLGSTVFTSVHAGSGSAVIGYVTNTGQTNVNLATVIRSLSGDGADRPINEVLSSQDLSLGAMQSNYANRISTRDLVFSDRYKPVATAAMGLADYQTIAASLGWNGFTSNLSASQQNYYGVTAANIIGMQANGQNVGNLWQAVVNEVPGVITDTGGLIAGSSADLARSSWLSSMGVVAAGAVGAIITGYTRHGLNQAIGRDGGVGVSTSAILDAVKNPVQVVPQAGGAVKYVGQDATVILNSSGKVITTYATGSGGLRGSGGRRGP